MDYDVIVIGGGSAGYAAARTAQEFGAKVAIIDKGPLGWPVHLARLYAHQGHFALVRDYVVDAPRQRIWPACVQIARRSR